MVLLAFPLISFVCVVAWPAATADTMCHPTSCMNNGTCAENNGNLHCVCADKFFGDQCQFNEETKLCLRHPCRKHGRCGQEHDEGTITCICDAGYYGTYCDMEYNECLSNPCTHGVCIDGVNSFVCDCNGTGYTGSYCHKHIAISAGAEWACLLILLIPLSLITYGLIRVYYKRNQPSRQPAYVILDNQLYNSTERGTSMTRFST